MALPHTRPPSPQLPGQQNPYDVVFAFSFLANAVLMTSVAMLFRYADFVRYCGGSELELGWIVGAGMAGALLVRYVQGVALDRWGTAAVWNVSLALFQASIVAHLFIRRVDSPAAYLARIVLMMAVAGAFGASTTFVALRAPQHRMAELIGVLGSSGFIGLAAGPWLGDRLFARYATLRQQVHAMFVSSALLAGLGWLLVAWVTRHAPRPPARRLPPAWQIIRRYHPGMLLLVAIAMGMGLQLPNIFLRPYAAELGLQEIHTFFLVYAAAAFVMRWLTRHWTDRAGAKPVALVGLLCLAASMVLYLGVRKTWHWIAPATAAGAAHALLFPAVVSGGSANFPLRYRGIAITLMLAMHDLGALLGQPLVGSLVELSRKAGWPAYPVTFLVVALLMVAVALVYAASATTTRALPTARPPTSG